MIEVVVGSDSSSKSFFIHDPLLTTSSAYFRRCLKSSFKEGSKSRVFLEEEDPQVFGLLSEYLYMDEVLRLNAEPISLDKPNPSFLSTMRWLSELWLLAHNRQMPKLVNYPMWRLLQWLDTSSDLLFGFSVLEAEELYERALMDSKLRKFLIDVMVWMRGELELSNEAPNLMLRDMMKELKREVEGRGGDPLLDVRNYYTPEEGLVPLKEKKVEAPATGAAAASFPLFSNLSHLLLLKIRLHSNQYLMLQLAS